MSSSYWILDDTIGHPSVDARPARPGGHRFRRTLLRGVTAGVVGASVATFWVLAADLWRGRPLDTPATLCAHLTVAFGSSGWRDTRQLATLFAGLQCAVFVVASLVAAAAVQRRGGALAGRWVAPVLALAVVAGPLYALFGVADAALPPDLGRHVVAAHLAGVAAMAALLWRTTTPRAGVPRHRAAGEGRGWASAPTPAPAGPRAPDRLPACMAAPHSARPGAPATTPRGRRARRKKRKGGRPHLSRLARRQTRASAR